jgi:hypothetical protein
MGSKSKRPEENIQALSTSLLGWNLTEKATREKRPAWKKMSREHSVPHLGPILQCIK